MVDEYMAKKTQIYANFCHSRSMIPTIIYLRTLQL